MADERWVTDTDPSTRLPVYTRLNANDVLADPITPLGASLGWIAHILPGWNAGYATAGYVSLSELAGDTTAAAGFFYGHLYVNLSAVRLVGIRSGIGTDAVDAMWFGGDPAIPPHTPRPEDESEEASARIAERNAWVLSTTTFPEIEEERAVADRLRAERPDLSALTAPALVARARSVMPLERLTWRGEVIATNGAALGPAVLGQLLADAGPSAVIRLVGSAGDVDSAAPSFALWDLSRTIRADAALSAAFDEGPDGLPGRATAASPDFAAGLAAFLRDFGYRGPNEWDIGSDSWETRPELVLGLLDRLRQLDEDAAPSARLADKKRETDAALAEAVAALQGNDEALGTLHAALASARRFGAWRERAKSNCIKVLHEARMPLVELAKRLHQQGSLEDPQHLFMATDDELDVLALEPATLAPTLSERHRTWRSLFGLDLPTFLDTSRPLPPLSSLPRRQEAEVTPVSAGDVLQGSGASAGVVRGRARIVLSMDALEDFQPGEVLVAPQTDPSWTPLFMVSSAAVVDVGAMGSHAMIVSRELGIPCAAGVPHATRRIPDGALLEVDGSSGRVTVLEV
jgi:pyruvate,water dikinase